MAPAPIYYLSPHADDVAFSCAGSVALDVAAGHPVTVITAFLSGADAALRRKEDEAAAAALGCTYNCLELPDAPDRPEIRGALGVFMPLGPQHLGIINEVVTRLLWHVTGAEQLHIRAPLAVGGHIDHRLVHEAARALAYHLGRSAQLTYYEDQPYSLTRYSLGRRIQALRPRPPVEVERAAPPVEQAAYRASVAAWPLAQRWLPGLRQLNCHLIARRAVSADAELQRPGFPPLLRAWLRPLDAPAVLERRRQAIAAHQSQWPLFAPSLESFVEQLDAYGLRYGDGVQPCERLWHDDGVHGPAA